MRDQCQDECLRAIRPTNILPLSPAFGGIFDLDPSPTRGEGIGFKRDHSTPARGVCVCELLHLEVCIIYSSPINGGGILFTIKVIVILLFAGGKEAIQAQIYRIRIG